MRGKIQLGAQKSEGILDGEPGRQMQWEKNRQAEKNTRAPKQSWEYREFGVVA